MNILIQSKRILNLGLKKLQLIRMSSVAQDKFIPKILVKWCTFVLGPNFEEVWV